MFDLLTWQDWAVVYFIIGFAVFLSIFVSHHLATRKVEPESPTSLAAIFDPKPTGLCETFLDSVLGPLIAIMLVCTIWPYAIWLKIEKKWFSDSPIEEKEFSVTLDDLREHLSFEKIEAAAYVTDPLGAVPDLPFGHLHGAWQRLKGNSAPGDQVWAFSAPWVEWRRKYLYSGYVIIHDGEIGSFWVTDYKPLHADNDSK